MGKKIFVGGLKNDISEVHLTQYFTHYGEVEKSEIMTDLVTGRNRGFGSVHFTDPSAADRAVLVKFHTVNGHRVEVKKALTKQEIQGEDATTPSVSGENQNEYGSSHGAGYSDQGSYGYGNAAGFYDNQGYGISNIAGYSHQGSFYVPPYSYGSGPTFNNHGAYSGTYTCGCCSYENLLGGGNVYNGYGQFYSGYNPNNYHFGSQGPAPYTNLLHHQELSVAPLLVWNSCCFFYIPLEDKSTCLFLFHEPLIRSLSYWTGKVQMKSLGPKHKKPC